jgi:hypothetical protein
LAAAGWMLLLGATGASFTAQRQVSASPPDQPLDTRAGGVAAWLLMTGLAATAAAFLF